MPYVNAARPIGRYVYISDRLDGYSAPMMRPPTANPNAAENRFRHWARPATMASAQLNASNASGMAIIWACRSLYTKVKSGNSVISLPPNGGKTRLGFQYQSPRPTPNGIPFMTIVKPWMAHAQRWKRLIFGSQENAGPAPISSNFWKISWIVPRLPRKSVRAEAARPETKGSSVSGDDSFPVVCSRSLANRFQPIENAQIPTFANSVGRIKL